MVFGRAHQGGDTQAVKRRYPRWVERDALGGGLAVLAADADLEWLMLDRTITRASSHSPPLPSCSGEVVTTA